MSSKPGTPQMASAAVDQTSRPNRRAGLFRRSEEVSSPKSSTFISHDEEKASESPSQSPDPTYQDDLFDLNHYKLVDELWHYTSVDTGRKCEHQTYQHTTQVTNHDMIDLCLGFNTLHGGAKVDAHDIDTKLETRIVPRGKRLWSWLTLCEDGQYGASSSTTPGLTQFFLGTVISMYEDPFPSWNRRALPAKQHALLPLI